MTIVDEVLAEEWESADCGILTRGDTIGDFYSYDPYECRSERARQAALGHDLLRIHALARNGELTADDWVAADAIVRELRRGEA